MEPKEKLGPAQSLSRQSYPGKGEAETALRGAKEEEAGAEKSEAEKIKASSERGLGAYAEVSRLALLQRQAP